MYYGGTKLHLVCFLTIAFEIVILLFQIIHVLVRPDDKKRLWYLLLLVFLIVYNICTVLFPSKKIPISGMIQTLIAYAAAFFMSMYFVFYFYKAYNLVRLRFFATYGLLIFLFAPYVFLFVVPYYLTHDIDVSRKLATIIPAVFGTVFVICVIRAFTIKYKEGKITHLQNDEDTLHGTIPASIALLCWASMPVITFFGIPDLERAVINTGFLVITISYVRSSIIQSKREYSTLQIRTHTMTSFAHESEPMLLIINNYLLDFKARYGMKESAEALEIITANLQRLSSRIQKFKLVSDPQIYNQATNISLVIKTKILLFEPLAGKKGVEIVDDIAPEIFLRDYPVSLDRVLNTLFENAVRNASENGKIDVSLVVENSSAILSVTDNGIKISMALPDFVTVNAQFDERKVAETITTPGAKRPYILIVGNNGSTLDYLAIQLAIKFNVIVADSRLEALEVLKSISQLDLIISDIMAGTMDDEEFRKQVTANEKFKGIPFIFLTDQKSEIGKKNGNKAEAVNYIGKPVVMTELKEKIDAYIERINTEKEVLREAFGLLRKVPSPPPEAGPHPPRNAFEYNCWKCGLTPREIEIVRLLNLGHSHKKIGEKLFISKKTVDTHVGNIFSKVRDTFSRDDLAGRVELLNILEIRSSTAVNKPD